MPKNQETIGALASHVGDAVGDEVSLYLELIRAELTRDIRQHARNVWPLLLAAPLLVIGYLLLCVAAGLALTPLVGPPIAWLLVGAGNVAGGAVAAVAVLVRYQSPVVQTAASVPEVQLGR